MDYTDATDETESNENNNYDEQGIFCWTQKGEFYVFNRLISIFLLDFEYPNAKIYSKDGSNNSEILDSLAFVINFVKLAKLNCISRKVQIDTINLINKQLLKNVCDGEKI